MPLLEQAERAHVVSVFDNKFEVSIKQQDLDLKHNYSILNCVLYSITTISLIIEHLALSSIRVRLLASSTSSLVSLKQTSTPIAS